MRTKLRGKFTLLFMAFAMMLALPAMAFADTFAIDGTDGFDTSNSKNSKFVLCQGAGGSVNVDANFNYSGSKHFKDGSQVSVTTSVEQAAQGFITAAGGSITLTGWNNSSNQASIQDMELTVGDNWTAGTFKVTYKASGTGEDNKALVIEDLNNVQISAATTGCSTDGGGSTPPPVNTAPTVNVEGPEDGAEYEIGSVPQATCSVDDEDAGASATPQVDSSGLDSHGLGSVTVTCSYEDSSGESGTDSVTYTIVDTTAPVIDSHADVTAEATDANGAKVNYTAPTANDAVYGSVDVNCLPASGSTFKLGETTVTCTAIDGSNNTQTSTFKVTVADKTAPVIDAHADVKAEATGPNGATVSYTKPAATDNVDASVTVNCTPASDSQFALGTTTVDCSATDAAGNKATSSFKVTVVDTTGPNITNVPSDITKEATSSAGAEVTYTAPNANDAVDGNRNVTCSPDSGSTFPLGTTEVTCSASDASGNTSSAKFNVTVQDTTAPSLTVPSNPVVLEATGPTGAEATYEVTAKDAVDPFPSTSCTPESGTVFVIGTTQVTCTAKDAAGNTSAQKTFDVTVQDTTAPKLNLPESKTVEATSANGAAVSFARTASDLVDGAVSVNCFVGTTPVKSGDTFALGTTTVDCSATDRAGNKASDSFTVTVRDTTAPVIDSHADVTEEATGPNGALVSYTSPGTTDAVDGSGTANCLPASGSQFALGTTTVTCNATDAAGNKATPTTFTVKVQDTLAPNNIQFVGNINDGDSFFFGDTPAQPTCTATDSGSGLNAAGCVVTGYSTAVGTHTLTATATDKAGNTATKTLSYTVKPYSFNGFYQPVDMSTATTTVWNTVKNGSTVPLKFELFKGTTELTDTSAIKSLTSTKVTCTTGTAIEDAIETVATGGTSLRYDSTGGQFIYNWKTPTSIGCYKVTLTATDGSTLSAYFKLK